MRTDSFAPHRQRGAAAVEFALVATAFFTVLFGIMFFGLVLFAWNSAAEATRYAARVAVVCNPNSTSLVVARMKDFLPALSSAQVSLTYSPSGCDVNNCRSVTVAVTGYTFNLPVPFMPSNSIPMPPFTTTLTRESLDSTNNSICS